MPRGSRRPGLTRLASCSSLALRMALTSSAMMPVCSAQVCPYFALKASLAFILLTPLSVYREMFRAMRRKPRVENGNLFLVSHISQVLAEVTDAVHFPHADAGRGTLATIAATQQGGIPIPEGQFPAVIIPQVDHFFTSSTKVDSSHRLLKGEGLLRFLIGRAFPFPPTSVPCGPMPSSWAISSRLRPTFWTDP